MQILKLSGPEWPKARAEFSALLLTCDGMLGPTARCLAGQRAEVEVTRDLYGLLSLLTDDPRAADMVVIDCDGFGGLDVVLRALGQIGQDEQRAPVILISQDCQEQIFPERRHQPVILRAPMSSLSLRLALELRLGCRGLIIT